MIIYKKEQDFLAFISSISIILKQKLLNRINIGVVSGKNITLMQIQ